MSLRPPGRVPTCYGIVCTTADMRTFGLIRFAVCQFKRTLKTNYSVQSLLDHYIFPESGLKYIEKTVTTH